MMTAAVRGLWSSIYLHHAEVYEVFSRAEDHADAILANISTSHALAGKRVLDLGAGTGRFAIELARRGSHVLAVEPAPAMAEILTRKIASESRRLHGSITTRTEPAETLKLETASFDLVLLCWVLSEIKRNLHDGEDSWARIDAIMANLTDALAVGGSIVVVETLPGSYFGEFQCELTGRAGDLSDGFTDNLIQRYGFDCKEIPIEIRFESAQRARTVCDVIYGGGAGEIISRNDGRIKMGVRLLSWRKTNQ